MFLLIMKRWTISTDKWHTLRKQELYMSHIQYDLLSPKNPRVSHMNIMTIIKGITDNSLSVFQTKSKQLLIYHVSLCYLICI